MLRLMILTLLLSSQSHAVGGDLVLKYYVKDAYTRVPTQKVGSFRVNEKCSAKSKSCQALKVSEGKAVKISRSDTPLAVNPASGYCWDVGAKARVLKDDNNNQYDYCVFEDGSMVDAWNLYQAHHPAPVIK